MMNVNKCNEKTQDKAYKKINSKMNRYQEVIESLSNMIIILFKNKKILSRKPSFEDPVSHIKRMNKKNKNFKELIRIMLDMRTIDNINIRIKDDEVAIKFISGEKILIEATNREEYKKILLSNMRMLNFDNRELFIRAKDLTLNFEFKDEVKFDENILIDDNRFKLLVDLESEEFYSNCLNGSLNIDRFYDFIISENFIKREKLDDYVLIDKIKKRYTFNNIIEFYFALFALVDFYFKAEKHYYNIKGVNSITPILGVTKNILIGYMMGFFKYILGKDIDLEALNELLELFTLGYKEINDLYYQPIINCEGRLIIMPSSILQNNFGRTFINYMNKLGVNLRDGYTMEEYVKRKLGEHQFKVFKHEKTQLNFKISNDKKGDIDVLALKEDYIFYGQIKNKPSPLDRQDFNNYDRKLLKVAVKQLKYAEEYLNQNPKKILECFNIESLKGYKLVPFILSNSFYRSGEIIEGIPITDMSAFNRLFEVGFISYTNLNQEKVTKKIRENDLVTAKELYKHLYNPYFKDAYKIDNMKIKLHEKIGRYNIEFVS